MFLWLVVLTGLATVVFPQQMAYGFSLVVSRIWLFLVGFWEITGEKVVEREESVVDSFERFVFEIVKPVCAIGFKRVGVYVVLGIVLGCVVWKVLLFAGRKFRGCVMQRWRKVEGFIQFEAMREGSNFSPRVVPKFQVPIYRVGLFSKIRVGYGIRVKDFLVVPTHVVEQAKMPFILGGTDSEGGVSIAPSLVPSNVLPDLSYVPLEPMVWTRVQVPAAPISSVHRDMFVTCAGPKGASQGYIRRSYMAGLVTYSGSTENGMSGAAYCGPNGMVFGMHTGASNSENVGVSSVVISKEINSLTSDEGKKKGGVRNYYIDYDKQVPEMPKEMPSEPVWTQEDIDKAIVQAKGGSWVAEVELDIRGINYESLDAVKECLSQLSPMAIRNLKTVLSVPQPVQVATQSLESKVVEYEDTCTIRYRNHEERLVRLENQVFRKSPAQPGVSRIPVRVESTPVRVESKEKPVKEPKTIVSGKKRQQRAKNRKKIERLLIAYQAWKKKEATQEQIEELQKKKFDLQNDLLPTWFPRKLLKL